MRDIIASTKLWPGRPRLLAGESLASWFARLARDNGLPPSDLFRAALPGAYLHSRDLDRTACPQLVANLERHTGVPAANIWTATLARWSGRVFAADDGLGKLPWLPPVGRESSRHGFGQQVCPLCLREDEVPHVRLTWRLAFVTGCDRHRILLVDRCPGCAAPLNPLKGLGADGVFRCWRCGDDPAAETPSPVRDEDLDDQRRLLDVAEAGWGELGEYGPIHGLAYFETLRLVFRLLATGRHALALRRWLERAGVPMPPPTGIPRIKEVEVLNPRCRHDLLRMASHLLSGWPARFVEACRGIGLSSSDLIRDPSAVPFAYWDAVTRHLSEHVRTVGRDEAIAAKTLLQSRGRTADYRSLVDLLGTKTVAQRHLADPAFAHAPYGTGRYWKLDGVSPTVREAVRRAAHRDGENVGGWVEKALRRALKEPSRPRDAPG